MMRPRVLLGRLLAGFALAIILLSSPALAHKEHRNQVAEQLQQAPRAAGAEIREQVGEVAEEMEKDRSSMNFGARLLDWFGRLHPFIVHFPIGFLPAALVVAVIGWRRPAFAAPVQFLVVAGGIFAPIAAASGWLMAMDEEHDQLLIIHQWLGIAIGAAGLLIAIWALRRPIREPGAGIILALTATTLAILAQGWIGAAMVHGIDHMSW